ncbi:hypothetical protein TREMEDRAFT_25391, partial [Tremella mesenterica DSM 1558]|uniref:uncharacterized protein n=1 Tax=Tremella mesenterica (strain ATCC 24925 / CBS 8224 / DSM 1558 / NBRC 9311 / NRRL Y-6157 / RJB 2259-6 / UBC 559-6) TaxID=578456 RepID=UPI0003F48D94
HSLSYRSPTVSTAGGAMPDSDSEDDFMSDKYLVEVPPGPKSYSSQRQAQTLKSMRKGQSKNQVPLRQLEAERRSEGLNTSLFDRLSSPASTSQIAKDVEKNKSIGTGGNKAMEMMMKMGWSVGESLGKKRSPSPSSSNTKRVKLEAQQGDGNVSETEDGVLRGGIGSSSRLVGMKESKHRVEPIRISMWAGRKGLTARELTPPPLPTSGRDIDALHPEKLQRLGERTEDFRERQKRGYAEKETEKKAEKAREKLVEFDKEVGVKFHPLHISPFDPLGTLPIPLLKLIYPSQIPPSPTQSLRLSPLASPHDDTSRSPSPPLLENAKMSDAERVREQMRRDMLSSLPSDEIEGIPFHPRHSPDLTDARHGAATEEEEWEGIDWEKEVPGSKRVLSMKSDEYPAYLLSQLRTEHLFCFWCGYKYSSFEEMDGPGGCPGEEEDDH